MKSIAVAATCLCLSTSAFAETRQQEGTRLQYEYDCAQVNLWSSLFGNIPVAGGAIGTVIGLDCNIQAIEYARIALDDFRRRNGVRGAVAYRAMAQASASSAPGIVAEMRMKAIERRQKQRDGDWRTSY